MEDNKKPTFNVFFPRGIIEAEYLEFLKKVFFEYDVKAFDENKDLPEIHLMMFTGGEDVTPAYYNENKGMYTNNNSERDEIEREEYHRFYYKIPKLGICRGAQFLTVMTGGKLIQHVTGHNNTTDRIYYGGTSINIPSDHHQMMYPFNLNKEDYEILGYSLFHKSDVYLNGENENIELPENFLEPEIVYYQNSNSLCIQSHPEWIRDSNDGSLKIIINLIRKKLLK